MIAVDLNDELKQEAGSCRMPAALRPSSILIAMSRSTLRVEPWRSQEAMLDTFNGLEATHTHTHTHTRTHTHTQKLTPFWVCEQENEIGRAHV